MTDSIPIRTLKVFPAKIPLIDVKRGINMDFDVVRVAEFQLEQFFREMKEAESKELLDDLYDGASEALKSFYDALKVKFENGL
jgi:hypothetical protein